MALVERGLAGHAGVHRDLEAFRERAQLRHRFREEDAGAGPDERVLRPEQGIDRGGDGGARRLVHRRGRRAVVARRLRHRLCAHVVRHLHHHRARAPVAQRVEGTAHLRPDLIDAGHHLRRLQHRSPGARGHEVRAQVVPVEGVALRQHQNRDVVGPRLREAAERVLRPRLRLHRHHPETPPVAHPREAVRRHHRAALVAEGDGADPLPGRGLDERVGREAGHPLHALVLQYPRDVLEAVHLGIPLTLSGIARNLHQGVGGVRSGSRIPARPSCGRRGERLSHIDVAGHRQGGMGAFVPSHLSATGHPSTQTFRMSSRPAL